MELKIPVSNLLEQLQYLLNQLTPEQYVQPVSILSGSSIGQHNRHILEFYIELYKGYQSGIVNYDKRERDHRIETNLQFAIATIEAIVDDVEKHNKTIRLEATYEIEEGASGVETNYFRELIYNLEHTVHHMAHIRIGVNQVSKVVVPDEFGVALSTLKYRRECAR